MSHKERVVRMCKVLLIEYFADGEAKQPSDLEDELIGGCNYNALFMGDSQWLRSPFRPALGALVDEGHIRAWEDGEGWHYQRAEKQS